MLLQVHGSVGEAAGASTGRVMIATPLLRRLGAVWQKQRGNNGAAGQQPRLIQRRTRPVQQQAMGRAMAADRECSRAGQLCALSLDLAV